MTVKRRKPYRQVARVTCPVCQQTRIVRGHGESYTKKPARGRCKGCFFKAISRPDAPKCVHCKLFNVNRPKGLCWSCYYQSDVRNMYPSGSRYARRGVGNQAGPGRLPQPTTALPGTPEKVEVLIQRAAAGEQLFHPDDARRTLEDPPGLDRLPPPDSCELEDCA